MSKHRIRISRRRLGRRILLELEKYVREILGYKPNLLFPDKLYAACFNDKCVIHEGGDRYEGVSQLYAGRWIGLVLRGKPYLSPLIYEEIYRVKGYRAAVIVSEKGVKAFLYGNDILYESILEKYPPLNNPVAVVDQLDNRVIGVAVPAKKPKPYYKNVYDLGMFLREWG